MSIDRAALLSRSEQGYFRGALSPLLEVCAPMRSEAIRSLHAVTFAMHSSSAPKANLQETANAFTPIYVPRPRGTPVAERTGLLSCGAMAPLWEVCASMGSQDMLHELDASSPSRCRISSPTAAWGLRRL